MPAMRRRSVPAARSHANCPHNEAARTRLHRLREARLLPRPLRCSSIPSAAATPTRRRRLPPSRAWLSRSSLHSQPGLRCRRRWRARVPRGASEVMEPPNATRPQCPRRRPETAARWSARCGQMAADPAMSPPKGVWPGAGAGGAPRAAGDIPTWTYASERQKRTCTTGGCVPGASRVRSSVSGGGTAPTLSSGRNPFNPADGRGGSTRAPVGASWIMTGLDSTHEPRAAA